MSKPITADTMAWKDSAYRWGKEYGVDPNVILAVINTESDGNAATDCGVCRGLMQISDETFSWCEQQLNVSLDVHVGDDNIRAGTYYLSYEAKQNGGSLEAALKQYGGYADGAHEDQYAAYRDEIQGEAQNIGSGNINWSVNGGTSSSAINSKDPKGILQFAQFAESLAFTQQMTQGFEQGMEYTLHSYLTRFMSKFYHNMYYIPTLPDNKAIVVKPETMFIDPPSCNVIYPTLKTSIGFTRTPKSEPTRILMLSDPVSNIFGVSGGQISQLVTMAFLDEDPNGNQFVKGISSLTDKKYPMRNITNYEKNNGVRILRTNQGEDLYLFLVSGQKPKDVKAGTNTVQATMLTSVSNPTGIASTLYQLASYSLLRNRYEQRPGNVQMYFNPYIVPGFPMLSVESGNASSLNVYGYVTDVTHQITERSWSTYVGFTGTHIEKEARPPVFPIIEQDYVKFIDDTYTRMLGASVSRVDGDAGAKACRDAYNASDNSVTSMLKKIWRPLTTMAQHLADICDGATVVQDQGYRWFKNGGSSTYFNTATQAIIKGYTSSILNGNALYTPDVR